MTTKGVQQASMHSRTQEHMELQLHRHFATHIEPSCFLQPAQWYHPLAQAWPRSQKSRQNSGSTPTPCLDRPVLARDTHSKARYVTDMPGIAILAIAENHIPTNSMGLQCVVQVVMNRMHNHIHEVAPLSLYRCVTNTQSRIRDHKKQQSQKMLKTAVQRPPCAWTSPCLRRGGGGGGVRTTFSISLELQRQCLQTKARKCGNTGCRVGTSGHEATDT